jgi:hypothetical protein
MRRRRATRRIAHNDADAEPITADAATFASLPQPLARRILLALPVDARGRASCVCRAWRDVLADPSLWSRLDMSVVSSGEWQRFFSVLDGAAGRARGQLRQLELVQHRVKLERLLPVLTANAGSLRELHLPMIHNADYHFGTSSLTTVIAAIVRAAPRLHVLATEYVCCRSDDALRMLRAEPPFATLQLRYCIEVSFYGGQPFCPFAAALADAALQPALLHVCVCFADTAQPAVMNALVDAALARRLRELSLYSCTPPAAALLVRLLTEGSLDALEFSSCGTLFAPLFNAADAALVADALRMNTTLTVLFLRDVHLWHYWRPAEFLLGALVKHTSLRELRICEEYLGTEVANAFGALLAALIAADAPALQSLNCANNGLGDAGLAPLAEALALNRHLRALHMHNNGMSEAFARERLLPAVRANTTLRQLACANYNYDSVPPAAAEAEELVRRRGQHD